MTVRELLQALEGADPDALVFRYDSDEDGLIEVIDADLEPVDGERVPHALVVR